MVEDPRMLTMVDVSGLDIRPGTVFLRWKQIEIEIEIVYNMYRVKPAVVSAPPVCAVSGLIITGARP
jgi:hypothetical protein